MTLQIKQNTRISLLNNTRLNEDLLHDRKIDRLIKEELEFYFKTNTSKETSESIVWEAHKAYIRGIIIKAGVEKERRQAKELRERQEEIKKLEQQHKDSGERGIMGKLYRAREAMRQQN